LLFFVFSAVAVTVSVLIVASRALIDLVQRKYEIFETMVIHAYGNFAGNANVPN
jgi:hypothetical protein